MSKLALLIGAKPRHDKIGPVVRFEKGSYVAELENVQDSVIMLCGSLGLVGRLTQGVVLELDGDYFTHITSVGKEKFINVSMNRVA